MVSLFERLDKGRPPPVEEPINQPRRGSPSIEKFLDWLVNHWAKTTVTAREIYIYGPNSIRNKKTTLRQTDVLVEQGWLIPIKTSARNKREWKVVRAPLVTPSHAHLPPPFFLSPLSN